jgi:ABC-type phosphate transport system substrate-binding protein
MRVSICLPELHFDEEFLRAAAVLSFIFMVLTSNSALAFNRLSFIVNADNPATTISVETLRDFYLKKKKQWPDGTSVRFLDRAFATEPRKIFVSAVMKRTPEDLDYYWIGEKLYSGTSAPLQEASDSMAFEFVGAVKGGISYVMAGTPITSKKVKVIKVE